MNDRSNRALKPGWKTALLAALALLAAAPAASSAEPTASSSAASTWLPVREIDLQLQPQSPLDFSALLPNGRIDAASRLAPGANGHFATIGQPDQAKRLYCASLAFGPAAGGFPDHDDADRYARQLAMHGYNIARFHFTDANLMFGRTKDFDFDPDVLDRIHYLMSALKKNGIYWMVDGLTSWRGGYGGYDDRWEPSEGLKLEVNYDDRAFAHWQRLVTDFLGRKNPYTGTTPLKDDALALVVLANENSMEFESVVHATPGKAYSDDLRRPFNTWLRARYGSTQGLRAVWHDLGANERLENASVRLPVDRYVDSPRLKDLQAFFTETERAAAAKMTRVVRDLGYRGAVTDFNNWPTSQASLSRQTLDAVAMNTYRDEVLGYQPGSKIDGKSSIADLALYMRRAAATRWLGKPFVITEYEHLFWNPFRYESGLLMPSYAALQDWDALCRHGAGPIVLRYGEPFQHKQAILPYVFALDPVARAGETLGALLFRRGDVTPAANTIPFAVRGEEDLTDHMLNAEPETLTLAALVSRIGLRASNGLREPFSFHQPRDSNDPMALLASLKTAGLIAAGNRTDPGKGIFESDTGQILIDRQNTTITVSTPRTDAAAFAALDRPLDLGAMTVDRSDGSALVSASAIDGAASLAESRRMLLIFATDARNTGMRFRDADEKVIDDFGRLPALIRKGSVKLSFKPATQMDARSGGWTLSPIGLDGRVHAAVATGTGLPTFTLSNDTPDGPTTYFLLERN
jgi:hypothetical protein